MMWYKIGLIKVVRMELIYRRAGCPPDSQQMKDLLTALSKSDAVETFGFYSRMSFLIPYLLSRMINSTLDSKGLGPTRRTQIRD